MCAVLQKGVAGAEYLASDREPFRWKELIEKWVDEFSVQPPKEVSAAASDRTSKKVNSQQTLKALDLSLKYPSVLEGVRKIPR